MLLSRSQRVRGEQVSIEKALVCIDLMWEVRLRMELVLLV